MKTAIDKIKPEVRAIRAYHLPSLHASVKINQNENPFNAPEEIRREVLSRLERRPWSRYPPFVPSNLLEKLAAHTGWRADGILAGNGSNELIQALMTATVSHGTKVIVIEPTFTLYGQFTKILGGEVISVLLNDNLTFNVPRIASRQALSKADMLFLCSPNNPTGCSISERDIRLLLRNTEGLVVVDQAYVEFGGDNFVPLLAEYPNLIILRTFSKAMAMAGLRVGYMLAAPELVQEINKAKLPYSINFFSVTAAEVALERFHYLEPLIDTIKSERNRLFAELQTIEGLIAVPSSANFILIRTRIGATELFEALHARGILVRDVSKYPMLSDFVRITVGTHAENDRLLHELRVLLEGHSGKHGTT